MKRKAAYLVINPRSGKNLAKLSDILAVFSAAGWKTDRFQDEGSTEGGPALVLGSLA
jgi:hypothetical protein